LSNIIFTSGKLRRWLITGNPGIGKTFLGYFLLYLFAQSDQTVIYHKHGRPPILFSEERVISGSIDEFTDDLGRENVWYIVDADKPGEYYAKTILICSPQVKYYKKFRDLGIRIMYMPVWSLAEIERCRINIDNFNDLKKEEVLDLYNKWGGIPRYVLFHARNYPMQKLLDAGINEVNLIIMNYVGEISHGNDVSHRLVHIRTNVPEEEEPEEENSPKIGKETEEEGESSTSKTLAYTSREPSTLWEYPISRESSFLRDFSKTMTLIPTSTLEEPITREVESHTSTTFKPILPLGISSTSSALAESDVTQVDEGVPYYSEFILEFASDYVAEGVISRLAEINKHALLEFVKSSADVNEYSTLRGVIFERLAHRL
jgi:hypothetical protein